MDIGDRAQAIEEKQRAFFLARAAATDAPEDALIIGGIRCCLDCEESIPEGRLAANPSAVRCVICQAKRERRG